MASGVRLMIEMCEAPGEGRSLELREVTGGRQCDARSAQTLGRQRARSNVVERRSGMDCVNGEFKGLEIGQEGLWLSLLI